MKDKAYIIGMIGLLAVFFFMIYDAHSEEILQYLFTKVTF